MTPEFHTDRLRAMNPDEILIERLTAENEDCVADLIRRNLAGYEEAGNVLMATFRRLENLMEIYQADGAAYFVARDMQRDGACIGGAGLGSFHGLPLSEGTGEIRDLVLEKEYRGRGLGTRLLKRSLDEAQEFQYRRLYLETTPQMEKAQKLFVRFGFRPVVQAQAKPSSEDETSKVLPCYYILEDLNPDPSF